MEANRREGEQINTNIKTNQNQKPIFKHRRVINIATVTDLQEVKEFILH